MLTFPVNIKGHSIKPSDIELPNTAMHDRKGYPDMSRPIYFEHTITDERMHPISLIAATLLITTLTLLTLLLALLIRLLLILPRGRGAPLGPRPVRSPRPVRLGIFLGSGGHTAEMRALLAALDFGKYERTYVYGVGDEMSLRAVGEIEAAGAERAEHSEESSRKGEKGEGYSLLALPRARHVGEGKLSTLRSATKTLLAALRCVGVARPWVDVLLLNGPGTGVVLVLVCYIRRILGLSYTRIIYVESFTRVKSLSLSGKLLRPLVDRFVVQWPDAAGPLGLADGVEVSKDDGVKRPSRTGVTYRGWLV